MSFDGVAFAVFVILFVVVAVVGFAAVRWRRVTHLNSLDQWGLGGRTVRDRDGPLALQWTVDVADGELPHSTPPE